MPGFHKPVEAAVTELLRVIHSELIAEGRFARLLPASADELVTVPGTERYAELVRRIAERQAGPVPRWVLAVSDRFQPAPVEFTVTQPQPLTVHLADDPTGSAYRMWVVGLEIAVQVAVVAADSDITELAGLLVDCISVEGGVQFAPDYRIAEFDSRMPATLNYVSASRIDKGVLAAGGAGRLGRSLGLRKGRIEPVSVYVLDCLVWAAVPMLERVDGPGAGHPDPDGYLMRREADFARHLPVVVEAAVH